MLPQEEKVSAVKSSLNPAPKHRCVPSWGWQDITDASSLIFPMWLALSYRADEKKLPEKVSWTEETE